jgi:hemoglobin
MSRRTIFDRYGGFASVSRVVSGFYERVLDSSVTAPYFASTDMRALIDHQTRFIATVMGGPASYTDDHLQRAHRNLGITDAAFDEVARLLRETLEDLDYADEDIHTVLREITSRRHIIVTRSGG